MRPLLATSLLSFGALLQAADPSTSTATNVPFPDTHYFVLVETTVSMKKQRDMALDTVNKLLLNSVNGRMRTNDTLTICAYSDRLHTNLVNDQSWDPNQRVDLANRIYRILRDLSSSKKKPNMGVAMDALKQAASSPGVVTAILVYSGSQPIEGTPFDNLVNEITGKHRDDMREAGKPFVTSFVIREGQYLGYGVTPGGRPIYLPPLPKPPPPPAVTNPPPTQTSSARTNKPRPMTVEEIEDALRKSQKPTAAPAPLTNLISTSTGPTDASTRTSAPAPPEFTNIPTLIAPVGRKEGLAGSAPGAPTPASPGSAPPSVAAPATNPPAASASAKPPAVAISATSNAPPRGSLASPPAAAANTSLPPAPPQSRPAPRNIVALVPASGTRAWVDLATGIALLLAAAGLTWILIRNLRLRPRPSLISRSMDEDEK